jgi:predicted RNA methylase
MRLAGRAKAGFYPTPLSVVERIIHFIKPCPEPVEGPGPGPWKILDPCCGLGDPLKRIAEHTGAESYGIELDRQRAAVAKEKLTHVICSDALSARISPGAFSLIFLNPPYDHDEKSRLEHRFLVQATAWLALRGLLIYLIPQGRYHANTLRYLASWYENVRLFRFPEEEYWRFKQTVLFAVKKQRAFFDPTQHEQMKARLQGDLPELPQQDTPVYTLPPVLIHNGFIFRSSEVIPEEALPEIATQGAWQIPEMKENLEPGEARRSIQPLMPLRQGHLAQLIAAGFINNQVLEKDGTHLLIKGRTVKSTVKLAGADEDTTIERDVIRTTIMAIDEKGRIIEIGEGG